jgi:hypothetical protein
MPIPLVDRPLSPSETFRQLVFHPIPLVVQRWNYKSAFFSSLCRALVFFFANLSSGWDAATGAMVVEFLYRACTSGFYGAITQAFRRSEPRWAASLIVMVALPIFSHSIEFVVHWIRGTPNLRTSITASLLFTFLSTSFNLHAMRNGVLIVGPGEKSLLGDMRSLPRVIWTFLSSGLGFAGPRS